MSQDQNNPYKKINNPKYPSATKGLEPKRGMNKGGTGKYRQGVGNVGVKQNASMVSKGAQNKNTDKGKLKDDMKNSPDGSRKVMSMSEFQKNLNNAGGRSINLDDGKEKQINSKDSTYTVRKLADGRVERIKRKKKINEGYYVKPETDEIFRNTMAFELFFNGRGAEFWVKSRYKIVGEGVKVLWMRYDGARDTETDEPLKLTSSEITKLKKFLTNKINNAPFKDVQYYWAVKESLSDIYHRLLITN